MRIGREPTYLMCCCFILLLTAACTGAGGGPTPDFEVRDSAGVEIVTNSMPVARRELVEDMRIGVEEGEEHYQFYRIGAMRVDSDGQFYVADGGSATIRVFSSDGEYLQSIGSKGKGPGEFETLFEVWLAPDEVLAYGRGGGPWALSRFHKDGEYIDFFDARTADRAMIMGMGYSDGSWLAAIRRIPDVSAVAHNTVFEDSLDIVALQFDGDTVSPPIIRSPNEAMLVDFLGLGRGPLFDPSPQVGLNANGQIYRTVGANYVIDVFNLDGELTRSIRRQYEPRVLQRNWLDTYVQRIRQHYDTLPDYSTKADEVRTVADWRVGSTRVSHLPPTDRMLVAPDGSMWLERADQDDEPWMRELRRSMGSRFGRPPTVWDVFDSAGVYRATVELPAEFRPGQVAVDWIVGVQPDELDVEYVVRYRIVEDG